MQEGSAARISRPRCAAEPAEKVRIFRAAIKRGTKQHISIEKIQREENIRLQSGARIVRCAALRFSAHIFLIPAFSVLLFSIFLRFSLEILTLMEYNIIGTNLAFLLLLQKCQYNKKWRAENEYYSTDVGKGQNIRSARREQFC